MSTHCTYHCAACDQHFSSLAAFDRHRRRLRTCLTPQQFASFEKRRLVAVPGICRLTKGSDRVECSVWTTEKTDQQQAFFRSVA